MHSKFNYCENNFFLLRDAVFVTLSRCAVTPLCWGQEKFGNCNMEGGVWSLWISWGGVKVLGSGQFWWGGVWHFPSVVIVIVLHFLLSNTISMNYFTDWLYLNELLWFCTSTWIVLLSDRFRWHHFLYLYIRLNCEVRYSTLRIITLL